MSDAFRHIVGIDLGTTNTAIASVDTSTGGADHADRIAVEPITQLVAAGELGERTLLPSALYLPAEHELAPGSLNLPWGAPSFAVGTFARDQGARVPGRLVSSAKSWLSHAGVDRTASILPWGAPSDVPRQSPVEASARYLEHIRESWRRRHPNDPLEEQEIVLTVPASFDEAARELTLEAAQLAGLGQPTLLEEPLAAFYHWLAGHRHDLQTALDGVSLVLVVDVGGGTTDLTLVQVRPGDDGPRLDRIAVGDHLLLGGDNIDLALARLAEQRLGGEPLDQAGFGALVESARSAKEALLAPDAPESRTVTVLGRSTRLLGGARTVSLGRDEVRALVLDGFLPRVPADAKVARRGGLKALGLPYADDPAITRHLAAFCQRHLTEGQTIDAVLLNGGTLVPRLLSDRLLDVLESWSGTRPRLLANEALDLAVSRGAAWYGLVRRGEGIRVGAGSARAYFLGVDTEEGRSAVCVVPRGLPEGQTVALPERRFALTVGTPVRFDVYSSTGRRSAKPGDLISVEGAEDLGRLPPLQTVVRAGSGATDVEVHLEAGMTEIGTLALFCVGGGGRFKLEFQLRGAADDGTVYETTSLPKRFEEARELIGKFYGKKPAPDVDPKDVRGLQRSLEKILGERSTWTLPELRELWSTLWAGAQKRRRTADHERMWLRLAGYSLRPGFGAPLDDWRAKETFSIFPQGLQFHQEKAAWDQWWILWRRIAGGLDEAAQLEIVDAVRPWLRPASPGRTQPRPKGPKVEGHEEMIRLVASLERLPVETKIEIADWLWSRLGQSVPGGNSWWTIGRLGARVPFYGSAHQVVPPEVAEDWARRLLKLDWKKTEGAAFAAASLARLTDDRARDLSPALREEIATRLEKSGASPAWVRMLREAVALADADEQRIFGESLPAGLRLVR